MKTDHKRRGRRLLLEGLFIVALIAGVRVYQQQGLAAGLAPRLEGASWDGRDVPPLARPMVVHFWSTWCPVCKLEHETIAALARDHPLVSIAMHSGDEGEVRRYLQEAGLSYPVIADPDGRIAARWGVRGVPATFVLDANRRIRFAEVGYTTELGLRARLWWAGWFSDDG